MLKPEELRIGNYVLAEQDNIADAIGVVKWIGRNSVSVKCDTYETGLMKAKFKSIPLTEEWLEKFGFQIRDDMMPYLEKLGLLDNDGKYYYWGEESVDVKIKYVHQLQNLFHSLTGEELTIKQPNETT